MCTSPICVPNNRYGLGRVGLNKFFNTVDRYIQVPCGHCEQCISMRQEYFSQQVHLEMLDRDLYYCTLTIKPSRLLKTEIGDYRIPYIPYKTLSLAMRRFRKEFYPDLRYVFVGEFGHERHRPHFHGLLSLPPEPNIFRKLNQDNLLFKRLYDAWSINVGSRRSPVYEHMSDFIYRPGSMTYDCRPVDKAILSSSGLNFYFSKYMFKADEWLEKLLLKIRNYDDTLSSDQRDTLVSLLKPRTIRSPHFGVPINDVRKAYLRKCVDFSMSNYPGQILFINPLNGELSPMRPSFRQHTLTYADYEFLYKILDHPLNSLQGFVDEDILFKNSKNFLDFQKNNLSLQKKKQIIKQKYL